MRLTPGWALAVLIATLVFTSAVVLHGLAPASCADGDELTTSGLYDKARKAYEAILDDETDSECAVDGLWRIGGRYCNQANHLWDGGAVAQAEKAYTAILAFQPLDEAPNVMRDRDVRQCALDGLREVRDAKEKDAKTDPCRSTCTERNDPDPDDPDPDDPEIQERERQEREVQERERQEREVQERERQERERQEPERDDPDPGGSCCPWTG